MKEKSAKKWFWGFMIIQAGILLAWVLTVVVVDPYFHYHKPLSGLSYRLYEERYINDGISRHFDYDAIITGTSMNQNFKTSEMDALFGTNSVKITYSGGGFQEIGESLTRALERKGSTKTVVWGLDYNGLIRPYDWKQYQYADYPVYLYDDKLFNDVSYVLNKGIMYHGCFTNLYQTAAGIPSTSFDEYSAWSGDTGLDSIMTKYERVEQTEPMRQGMSEEESSMVAETVEKNLISIANANPETTFYFFYTPYSIVYWDDQIRTGSFLAQLEAEQLATQMLLECPNVQLYCFFENQELICNPEHYRDKEHYSAEISTKLLEWMSKGEYRLTKENYKEHTEHIKELYSSYDYDAVFNGKR